ncbi:MAG: chemotaxis protein CheW [Rhodospirillaceae bacterium]|nr:chemotaxis protein CheW [Rhodospirillaceae bacterium]
MELSAVEEVKNKKQNHMMAVTVEHHNELYTLLVDSVGDVIPLSKENYEGNPSTLDPLWREFAGGVYRLEGRLMVVLDVERLLDFRAKI